MSHKLKTLITPSAVRCFIALFIQQLVVGSSIYFLTHTTELFSSGLTQRSFVFLSLYFISLVLPFFPGAISLYFSRKWKVELIQKLFNKYIEEFAGQSRVWLNKTAKEKLLSLLGSEVILTSNRYVGSIYSFSSILLNVSFTIISLSVFLDAGLLPIYVFSIILSAFVYRATITNVSKNEIVSQEKRNKLSELLRRSWDPLLLKNSVNYTDWKDSAESSVYSYYNSEATAERSKLISNISLSLSSFLPILAYIGWRTYTQSSNSLLVLATLVNLPRVFMLMNNTYSILCETIELKAVGELWNKVIQEFDPVLHAENQAFEKIQESQIHISTDGKTGIALSEFMQLPHLDLRGLYTVKGPNGSGKSLSLLKLKEKYREAAYLLPATHDLFVNDKEQLSSGQKARKSLEWIKQNNSQIKNEVKILLLDEWNANIDQQKTKELEGLIAELAQSFLIIEVRHDA